MTLSHMLAYLHFLGLYEIVNEAFVLTLSSATFHMVVLDLFRPYIASDQQHGFRAYWPHSSSPRTILAASVTQLKGWSQILLGDSIFA